MSNKLNYSNIDDAWGLPESSDSKEMLPLNKRFNYKKPSNNPDLKDNIMTINSNELTKPIKHEFKPVQETYADYIKPCELVNNHIYHCEECRNRLLESMKNVPQKNIENYNNVIETYNSFDINENFENISPSQKNLLIVILYGILIILISDLIIKEE